jgi:hopanoid biosynthesis associated RND transporter like protein HpnN
LFARAADTYRRIVAWLVETSARAAAPVLIVSLVVTAALLYYTATHLSFNTNTLGMLDPSLRFLQLDREYERAFPQFTDLIVVVIDGDTANRADDAAARLTARLRRESALFTSVYYPGGESFFAHNGLLYLGEKELYELSDKLAEAEPFLAILSRDPSLRGVFSVLGRALDERLSPENEALLGKMLDEMSRRVEAQLAGKAEQLSWREQLLQGMEDLGDARRGFVLVQPRIDYSSLRPGKEALDAIRQLAEQLQLDRDHGVRVRLTGPVAMADEELGTVTRGAKTATMLSFGLVCLILFLGLRSPRLVFSVLVTLTMGLVWTAAFATFAIGHLNLISVTFAVLFIGLGVDFGIQFTMCYRDELHPGVGQVAALRGVAASVGGALTLAAVAAAVGFFSFVPTSYRGLAELGIISGAGMVIALLANLTVLPALLTVLPPRLEPGKPERAPFAKFCFSLRPHSRAILWATVVLGVGAGAVAPLARFDFNPLNLKDPTTESVATFRDLLGDPDTTPYTIDILTKNLPAAEELAARLERLDVVDKAVTVASYIPKDQDRKLGIVDDLALMLGPVALPAERLAMPSLDQEVQAFSRLREKLTKVSEKAAHRQLGASMRRLVDALDRVRAMPGWPEHSVRELQANLVGDLQATLRRLRQLLAPRRVTMADLPQDLKERYLAADGRARVEVFPKHDMGDNRALRRFVAEVQAVAPQATNTPVTLVESGKAVVEACMQAAVVALLATVVLLGVILRRLVDTLLILLPLALATLSTVASSVLLNSPFNFANVIALPLLLGLGIAYGIYLVMRMRRGKDVYHLLESSTPRAVFFSALTTMASFGTLAFVSHRGMSSMGLLLTVALSFALLFTLVVVPAIMTELEGRRELRATQADLERHRSRATAPAENPSPSDPPGGERKTEKR